MRALHVVVEPTDYLIRAGVTSIPTADPALRLTTPHSLADGVLRSATGDAMQVREEGR